MPYLMISFNHTLINNIVSFETGPMSLLENNNSSTLDNLPSVYY